MQLKKLILIGFMGSGKSSIAPLLATKLGFTAIDADQALLELASCASIADIFSQSGEKGFRDLEAHCVATLRDSSSVVIATGGGVIGREENMNNLAHGGGVIVFLDTSFDEVKRRITNIASRPLFNNSTAAEALYRERLPVYRRYANFTVHTDGKDQETICAEILSLLEAQL